MKINVKEEQHIYFSDVKARDVFKSGGEYYIKTSFYHKSGCMCTNLKNGDCQVFDEKTLVIKVDNAELVIGD